MRLAEERKLRAKRELQRREEFVDQGLAWLRGLSLQAFCDELEKHAESSPEQFDPNLVKRWLAWARSIAGRYDPIKNGFFAKVIMHTDLDSSMDCREANPSPANTRVDDIARELIASISQFPPWIIRHWRQRY